MMKKLLVIFFLFNCSFSSFAQDGWSAYMMPGIVHKQLMAYSGEYRATMSVWSGTGVQAETFDLRAVITPIMDGRFLQIKYDGEIMNMKFEAISQLGYNNITGKFFHIDFSSFGTDVFMYEGVWDQSIKVANLTGSTTSPSDKKIIGLRESIKFIGMDQIVFEIYETHEGSKEFKSTEFMLDRKKTY